jgi:Flp pilus assembly pilin Flp
VVGLILALSRQGLASLRGAPTNFWLARPDFAKDIDICLRTMGILPGVNDVKKFLADDSGATAIEYSLIAGAMGICLVAAMPLITRTFAPKFTDLGNKITNPAT